MTLTLTQLAAFAAAFMVAVASPGPMVAAIVARSMAFGFASGAAMACGAVVGDVVFALTAMFGLAALAAYLEGAVAVLKYVGAAWLIWLGVQLIRAPAEGLRAPDGAPKRDSLLRAFLSAAAVGLGNPKAMLFYLAVFPGFFDVTRLTAWDAAAILAVIAPLLVAANLVWAAAAAKAGRVFTSARAVRAVNAASGGLLGAAGVAVAAT